MNFSISQDCIDLVKEFEGLHTKKGNKIVPYYCPAGVLTIGYGHTELVSPTMSITVEEAESLLKSDLEKWANTVKNYVGTYIKTQSQLDALTSLCFNCGQAPVTKGKSITRALEKGDYEAAADAFNLWVKGGGRVLPGLVERRKAERELFIKDGIEKKILIHFKRDTLLKSEPIQSALLNKKDLIPIKGKTALWASPITTKNSHTLYKLDSPLYHDSRRVDEGWLFNKHISSKARKKAGTFEEKVLACIREREFPMKGMCVVGLEGISINGKKNDDAPDRWNDSISVWQDGKMLAIYEGTTEPGRYYTAVRLLNRNGAARYDVGYHPRQWVFGLHRGKPALVQRDTARIIRDRNKNYSRDDVKTVERGNGLNLHAGGPGLSIGRWSAGCVVVKSPREFKKLYDLLKSSGQSSFDFILLWRDWVL